MTGKSVRQFKDLSGQYPIFNFDRTLSDDRPLFAALHEGTKMDKLNESISLCNKFNVQTSCEKWRTICNKFLVLRFWAALKWKISFLSQQHQYFRPYLYYIYFMKAPMNFNSQGLIDSSVILTNLSFLWFLVCVHYAHFQWAKRFTNTLKFRKSLWPLINK